MKRFKTEFKTGLGTHKQLYKDEELVLYSLSIASFELFTYKVRPPNNFVDDDYEVYPSPEDFGSWAWSCTNPSCVAKVLTLHFPNHPLTKSMLKHVDGTYKRNGETLPHFNLTEDELMLEIAGLAWS